MLSSGWSPIFSNSFVPISKTLEILPSVPVTSSITVCNSLSLILTLLGRQNQLYGSVVFFKLSLGLLCWPGSDDLFVNPCEFFTPAITANLIKSPGLFSVFYSILMLWSLFSILLISYSSILLSKPFGTFKVLQLKFLLVSKFLQLSGKVRVFVYLFDFYHFHSVVHWNEKINIS